MKPIYEIREKASNALNIAEEDIRVYLGKEENYRNRMDFTFYSEGLGLRAPGKWYEIVPQTYSPLASKRINELLVEIPEKICDKEDFIAFDVRKKTGLFKYGVIRNTSLTESVTFIVNENSEFLEKGVSLIKEIAPSLSAENVLIGYVPHNSGVSIADNLEVVKGDEYLTEEVLGKRFKFHSQGFFQVNIEMTSKIIGHAASIVGNDTGVCLDLYGGVGLFGISLCENFNEVCLIESHAPSVKLAEENARLNDVKNFSSYVLDAKDLGTLMEGKKDITVLLDPPRGGMHKKALKNTLNLNARRILYISCNPNNLIMEIPHFREAGYKPTSCALFDMFPSTKHAEMVVDFVLG